MARDLASVVAYAPRDYVGAMDAAIDLRSERNTLLDSQIVRLEWIPKAPPPEIASRPQGPTLDPEEIARLVQRGQQFMQTGDLASARLMLRRAADAGSASAALALGASFDPLVLQDLGVLGMAPNTVQARAWYQMATELGSTEAPRRIERLQQAQP
jgi:TPR repeat protein